MATSTPVNVSFERLVRMLEQRLARQMIALEDTEAQLQAAKAALTSPKK